MLTSIDVKFIFDSAHLGLFSSANIFQIADVAFQVVFLLFLPCFQLHVLFHLVLTLEMREIFCEFFFVCVCVCCIINFYCILQEEYPIKLWEKKCPPFLFSQLKTTQPCSRVFSVNGALTCKEAALLTSSVDQQSGISLNLRTGPTGHATLFNQ